MSGKGRGRDLNDPDMESRSQLFACVDSHLKSLHIRTMLAFNACIGQEMFVWFIHYF